MIFLKKIFEQDLSGNPPRMSYAQVAQHQKENLQKEKTKEKQNAEHNNTPSSNGKSVTSSNSSTSSGTTRVQTELRDTNNRGIYYAINFSFLSSNILQFSIIFAIKSTLELETQYLHKQSYTRIEI